MLVKKFEEQVKKTPNHIAIKTGKRSISYRELNRYANRISRLLTGAGPTNKEAGNVGLLLEHGLQMISAILGTLKAGKVYVPLSTDYPHNRLSYMLEDSEASLLIANHATMEKAKNLTGKNNILLLELDGCENAAFDPNEDENFQRESSGESLAYILYTSGSTGKPKGVMQTHQNILYFIQHWTQRFSITNADRITLLASFCHDGSIPDIYSALLNGANLYPYDVRTQDHHSNLVSFLIQERITVWHSVPSLYNFFVNTLTGKEYFPDLRHIILGGEALRGYEIEMFKKYFPGAALASIYGQTESTVNSLWTVHGSDHINHLLLGTPLDHTRLFVVDGNDDEVDTYETGEILVASPHISPGYWKNKEMTKKVFSRDPAYGPLYWTGDMGRLLPDGNIEFMGRKDFQVKIRGYRVELGEIETTLMRMQGISEAVVVAKEKEKANTYLCAFFSAAKEYNVTELRNFLSGELPDYMIPAHFVPLDKMPLTPTGKIDRKTLAMMEIEPLKSTAVHAAPQTEMEKIIANTWKQVLGLEEVGIHDNLFEIGGNSFDIININSKLSEIFRQEIPIVKILEYPTIEDLARYLQQHQTDNKTAAGSRPAGKHVKTNGISLEIAVIGMAGRFPGARNIDEFWENLKNGVEAIAFFNDETLIGTGSPPEAVKNSNYVKAKGVLEGIEYFDASFFNFTPPEADVMDPQLRIFFECCWETFEHGGYNPSDYKGAIGVYAGNAFNIGWLAVVFSQMGEPVGQFEKGFLNNHLSTYISYKLDLTGPSVTIRTACSTSLVAVHQACQGLLLNECNMALAGGVSFLVPQKTGYLYHEGMIYSSDGHVRAFDAHSKGTVFGDGVGCVLLKRLEHALCEGDMIYAVIKGSAVNNDGIKKVGYTAPGTAGQREVIQAAQMAAGFEPGTIGFIETHGTGTTLGDAVEIEALNQVFPVSKKKYCALASVKTNVGHLNTAAGITGFIKTVLALNYKLIPPSLHFETPNPEIDYENNPFYINTKLIQWEKGKYPLRAGVSSFGFGGTNAHVVLEERPGDSESVRKTSGGTRGLAPLSNRQYQLILLSARTSTALEKMTENLTEYFKKNLLNRGNHENPTNPGPILADAAYTLQVGRRVFQHRRMLVCPGLDEALELLTTREPGKVFSYFTREQKPWIVFMFPGQGSQYVNMGLELYETEPVFREEMNHCFRILKPIVGYDIKEILYPSLVSVVSKVSKVSEEISSMTFVTSVAKKINQTEIAQPLLFVIEYALAKLLIKWGIKANAMIGHSVGEYTAACLSGVLSLADALNLIALRGKLIQEMPGGSMLSVGMPEEEILPLLNSQLSLAAVNSTSRCVVSGPPDAVEAFAKELKAKGQEAKLLHTSHAFHSALMDPILEEFKKQVISTRLNEPQIPYISNITGKWITAAEAADTGYWSKHIRSTVRFSKGIETLLEQEHTIFIEIGPGNALSTFVRQHKNKKTHHWVVDTLRRPIDQMTDDYFLVNQIGQLWLHGVKIDWTGFHTNRPGHRIPLPAYPFEGQCYKIDGNSLITGTQLIPGNISPGRKPAVEDWFYIQSWKYSDKNVYKIAKTDFRNILVFWDNCGLGSRLVKKLEQKSRDMIVVKAGKKFAKSDHNEYIINPKEKANYDALFSELQETKKIPGTIVHLWNVTKNKYKKYHREKIEDVLDRGFHSLINIAQAIGKYGIMDEVRVKVVTNHMLEVTGGEMYYPGKATIIGPVKVIPLEYPNIKCSCIDIIFPVFKINQKLVDQLVTEITGESLDRIIAYRNDHRWVPIYEPVQIKKTGEQLPLLKKEGIYMLTGGLGGIGLLIAEFLAKTLRAKLILIGRSEFPLKDKWEEWLSDNDKDDPLSRKIQKIKEFEQSGSEVLVFSADVTDKARMQEVTGRALRHFGTINGVIHTAGIPDGELIQRRTKEKSQRILAPKVMGTLVLDDVLKNVQLDFFILFSSINSILAPMGQAAYTAANVFQDSYAIYKNSKISPLITSISWDRWQNTGMATISEKLQRELTGEPVTGGITPEEGVEIFTRILGRTFPHITVITNDLKILTEKSNTVGMPAYMSKPGNKSHISNLTKRQQFGITTSYAPPSNEIERMLAEVFEEFFGIDQVGINDDIFQLGGDSLKAIILTSQINKKGCSITLADILTNSTIKELAAIISGKNGPGKSAEEDIYEKSLLSQLECIEKLNKGRNEKNIFIIHPRHGMVNQYKELALLLEKKYNVYGIQARGVKPGSKMSESPRQMIDDYLEQILAVQKNGPFIIAGYCIGAIISYEIVRKLESLDHPVEKLILFDSHALFTDRNAMIIQALEYLPGFVKRVILFFNDRKFKKAKQAGTFGKIDGSDGEEIKWGNDLRKEQVEKYMDILGNHVISLEIIKTPILITQSENGPYTDFTEAHFNKETKSKSTLIRIPGDHDSIWQKPDVEKLAEIIQNNV